MKRWLICILAVLLILAGCDGNPAPETTQTQPAPTTEATTLPPPPSLYVQNSVCEQNSGGAVRAYMPETGSLISYGFMGREPVLLAYTQEGTLEAIRMDGNTGEVLARGPLAEGVDVWSGMGMGENRLVCYDYDGNCLRVYDGQFRELRKIPLDDAPAGNVAFSQDMTTAYYSCGDEIRALDLESGIARLLMKLEGAEIYMYRLLFDDSVINCYVYAYEESYDAFFSAADGRRLGKDTELMDIYSFGDSYLVSRNDGPVTEILLGSREGELRSFRARPGYSSFCLLPNSGLLTEYVSGGTELQLSLYESVHGNRQAMLRLEEMDYPRSILDDAQGRIWFLATSTDDAMEMLCCWDPTGNPEKDTAVRIGKRCTAEDPDLEALALCKLRAQELEEQYGVEIYLYTDPVEPYDYVFTPEYQISAIEAGLDAMEAAMAKLPEGFLETTASVTESKKLHISLVRAFTGTEYNTVSDVVGLQYEIDGDAYIALLAVGDMEMTFYHELCHAMDNYVTVNSIHYDFWEDNNPEGFRYDECYTEYDNHWDSIWLEEETRAFIDAYSMTYAHEDRARIFEYAMTEGNEAYFATETMQAKLRQLCLGIRQAYGWKKHEGTFIWEQYLQESLAYVKKK